MYTKLILFASIMAVLVSCNETKKEKIDIEPIAQNKEIAYNLQENDGFTLMKSNCYICHNPNTKSHDDIIAPPFVAVKKRYSKQYENEEAFINAVVNWVQNPNEEEALMRGAVKEFKVMPKMPLETKILQKIASYMYENEMEEPEWFGEHVKEMHGDGTGKGMGKGQGKGKGRGKGMHRKNN